MAKSKLLERLEQQERTRAARPGRSGSAVEVLLEPVPDLAGTQLIPAAKLLTEAGVKLDVAKRALEAAQWGTARVLAVECSPAELIMELAALGFPSRVLTAPMTESQRRAWSGEAALPTKPGTQWKPPALVRIIRSRLGLSQTEFAARYGIPVATIRDWEIHRTKPEKASLAYLKAIEAAGIVQERDELKPMATKIYQQIVDPKFASISGNARVTTDKSK